MDLGILSLVFFVGAMICSMFLPINIGIIGLALTIILKMMANAPVAKYFVGFPVVMFIMVLTIMTMFSYAHINGTMEKIARTLLRLAKGKVGLIPIIMFIASFIVAALGPGAYAIGMIAPIALSVARKAKINPLLMIVAVGSAINAAGLSPFAVAGSLAAEATKKFGAGDLGMTLFINGLIGNVIVGAIGYVVFGGLKLWKSGSMEGIDLTVEPFNTKQKITTLGIVALMVAVIGFKINISVAAIFIILVYMAFKVAEEKEVFRSLTWSALIMVCGISTLIAAVEEFGGIKLFVAIVSKYSTGVTANTFLSLFSGIVSAYAASSPTMLSFLPLVPGLAANTGASVVALASSVVFSAFVVDCSPFSAIGAVSLANLDPSEDYDKTFRGLLIWAVALILLAALISTVLFGMIMY